MTSHLTSRPAASGGGVTDGAVALDFEPSLLRRPRTPQPWQPVILRPWRPPTLVLLVVFLVLQFLIPARLVIGGMGAVGRPSVAVGILLVFLWLVSARRPDRLPRGRQPIRWLLGAYLAAQLVGYAVGYDRLLPQVEANAADRYLIFHVAMVGVALAGNNMLPPTLALVGVMWLQLGLVLLCESPARRFLGRHRPARVVAVLSALGMPLYLWHKLAELPAAWLGERLGAPIDAGDPGEPGFWLGRLVWITLCALVVAPVMAAVVWFEMRRRRDLEAATGTAAVIAGGIALFGGIGVALAMGGVPGALVGLAGVAAASWLLRAHPQQPAR